MPSQVPGQLPGRGALLDVDEQVVDLSQDDLAPREDAPRGGRRWWRGVAPVVAALLAGAVLGGVVTHNRAEAAAQADRRATLAVDARITGSVIGGQRLGRARISLKARLRNLGPEPVEVLVRPDYVVASREQPVVITGADPVIEPGGSTALAVELSVRCGQLPLPSLTAPVRTADGRTHEVPMRSAYGDPVETLCGNVTAGTPWVSADVVGSTDEPMMLVTNGRRVAVRLDLPVRVSYGPNGVAGLLRVTSTPRLPLVVPAGGQRRVAIEVTATRCERDLEVLASLDTFANPALRVTSADGRPLDTSTSPDQVSTRVDLSTLVDQALARACT